MAISLTPLFRKQVKSISKEVFSNFGRIRITYKEVILQKRLFWRKHRIPVIDFLTEILPKEINEWAESKNIESPLPYFANSVQFLLHMDSLGEKNIISYLWKCYTHVITLDALKSKNITEVEPSHMVYTRVTTNVVSDRVVKDLKRMRNNVRQTYKVLECKCSPLDIVYKSPDIRGSPKIRTYLAKAG